MCATRKIDKRKVQAYDLLRQINRAIAQAKEWQGELNRLEGEVHELEQADVDA